jgi:ABC-type phosphate transport system auxiliary subunit
MKNLEKNEIDDMYATLRALSRLSAKHQYDKKMNSKINQVYNMVRNELDKEHKKQSGIPENTGCEDLHCGR